MYTQGGLRATAIGKCMVPKIIAFCIATSIMFSLIHFQEVKSATVVHPYDWAQVGAYVTYLINGCSIGIVYPNGTVVNPKDVFLVSFTWVILERKTTQVRLNVTLLVEGRLYTGENMSHSKTLPVDVDLYTRESYINDESIGKTCFFVEPYRETGDNITLYSNPDVLVARVSSVKEGDPCDIGYDVKYSTVLLRSCVSNATTWGHYLFSYYNGIAIYQTLIGSPWTVPSEDYGRLLGRFENGTEYNVTRYAGTILGAHLGLWGVDQIQLPFNKTNIDLALETQPETPNPQPPSDNPPSPWQQYLPYVAVGVLTTVAAVTLVVRRRRHATK